MGTYNLTGLNYIDSLLKNGKKWGSGNQGTGANITYNFASTNTPTQAQQARIRDGLNAWSEMANVTFTSNQNP